MRKTRIISCYIVELKYMHRKQNSIYKLLWWYWIRPNAIFL